MAQAAELFEGLNRVLLRLSLDETSLMETSGVWLVVELSARADNRVWTEEDTCLNQADVERLAVWAETVADGERSRLDCSFSEADLRFVFDSGKAQSIQVECDLEFAPPEWKSEAPFVIAFRRDPVQLRTFAVMLRQQLAELANPSAPPDPDRSFLPPPPRFRRP